MKFNKCRRRNKIPWITLTHQVAILTRFYSLQKIAIGERNLFTVSSPFENLTWHLFIQSRWKKTQLPPFLFFLFFRFQSTSRPVSSYYSKEKSFKSLPRASGKQNGGSGGKKEKKKERRKKRKKRTVVEERMEESVHAFAPCAERIKRYSYERANTCSALNDINGESHSDSDEKDFVNWN